MVAMWPDPGSTSATEVLPLLYHAVLPPDGPEYEKEEIREEKDPPPEFHWANPGNIRSPDWLLIARQRGPPTNRPVRS